MVVLLARARTYEPGLFAYPLSAHPELGSDLKVSSALYGLYSFDQRPISMVTANIVIRIYFEASIFEIMSITNSRRWDHLHKPPCD